MAMADDKMVDKLTASMVKKMTEEMDERMMKEASATFTGGFAYDYNTIWKPKELEEREYRKRWERDLYQQWDKVSSAAADPVHRLRKEMHDELGDIKTAIRKMGIMLDSDKPTKEQLEKSKMLKEAYLKYKMVEGLVLGKNGNDV